MGPLLRNAQILVVDDDPLVSESIRRGLLREGASVSCAGSLAEAVGTLETSLLDAAIVDRVLPDGDGLALFSPLREHSDAMCIVLSGRTEERDVLDAYAAAADLCLRKPMTVRELAAHVAALLANRRPTLRIGPLTVSLRRLVVVFPDGVRVRLAVQEFAFLTRLAATLGAPVSRDELVQAIWAHDGPDSNSIDVLAFRLRRKLRSYSTMLETVRNGGFRLRVPEEPSLTARRP